MCSSANRRDDRRAGWLVLVAVGLPRLLFALSFGVQFDNDSPIYLGMIPGFLDGVKPDLYSAVNPPSECDVIYPPGYPLFALLARVAFFLPWSLAIVLLQHALVTVGCYLVYLLGRREGFPRAGMWAALLFGWGAESLFYGQMIYSEASFFAMMMVFFWMLSLASGAEGGGLRNWRLVAAGAALVVCVAMRPAALAFIPLAMLYVLAGRFADWAPGAKERFSACLKLGAVAVAGVALIVVYNGLFFSVWGMKSFNGRNFYNRVVGVCQLVDAEGPATMKQRELTGREVRGFWWDSLYALRSRGMGVRESDSLMGRVAYEGFRKYPAAYFERVLKDGYWVLLNTGYPFLSENPSADKVAYEQRAKQWTQSGIPQERLLRETFVRKLDLVGPGEVLPSVIGNSIYSIAWRVVPKGRERPFVWGYGAAVVYLVVMRLRSQRVLWAACSVSYVMSSVAAEWNSTRYFVPCIGLAYLLLFTVIGETLGRASTRLRGPLGWLGRVVTAGEPAARPEG